MNLYSSFVQSSKKVKINSYSLVKQRKSDSVIPSIYVHITFTMYAFPSINFLWLVLSKHWSFNDWYYPNTGHLMIGTIQPLVI